MEYKGDPFFFLENSTFSQEENAKKYDVVGNATRACEIYATTLNSPWSVFSKEDIEKAAQNPNTSTISNPPWNMAVKSLKYSPSRTRLNQSLESTEPMWRKLPSEKITQAFIEQSGVWYIEQFDPRKGTKEMQESSLAKLYALEDTWVDYIEKKLSMMSGSDKEAILDTIAKTPSEKSGWIGFARKLPSGRDQAILSALQWQMPEAESVIFTDQEGKGLQAKWIAEGRPQYRARYELIETAAKAYADASKIGVPSKELYENLLKSYAETGVRARRASWEEVEKEKPCQGVQK